MLSEFAEACRVIVREGYTPVNTASYERLRAWLDLNGWPPQGWSPPPVTAQHKGRTGEVSPDD